jgi:DNA repair protein RadC
MSETKQIQMTLDLFGTPAATGEAQTVPMYRLKLVRDNDLCYEHQRSCDTPETVAKLMRPYYSECPQEQVVVLFLFTKLRVIGFHVASVGTLDASIMLVREVFCAALVAQCAGIIAVHNHPSGCAEPTLLELHRSVSTFRLDLLCR